MLSEVHSTRSSIRRNALNKLAALSAQTASAGGNQGDSEFEKLCELQRPAPTSAGNGSVGSANKQQRLAEVPMGIRELEVLVALARAAPAVHTAKDAATLLRQLAPYVPEVHRQTLNASSLYQQLPPWETLAYDLTAATLTIGLNHTSLRAEAFSCIDSTIEELVESAQKASWIQPQTDDPTDPTAAEKSLPAVQLCASLLGFLRAIADHIRVWSIEQRVEIIRRLRILLSEKLMVAIEGALSAIRNARTTTRAVKDWKRWVRHHAARGRPLGAMLLQQAFMQVVQGTVLLLVSPELPLAAHELLSALLISIPLTDHSKLPPTTGNIEELAEIIADEMAFLAADADYLQLGSAWQQHLALDVKAICLRSFLCCTIIDEEIADDELLLAWLDATAADPVQMANERLAQTVLESMTVLARLSPAIASGLARSLPRLIVQGKLPANTARLAGACLAHLMRPMSQDVVISTLYSLGNVLSASAGADRNGGPSPITDGSGSANGGLSPYNSLNGMGSSISLVISDDDEGGAVSGAVVQAIVAVASARNDPQLTALVISMLVQKIGRISLAVDARAITEMAPLGLCGGPNEMRALLRLYARIISDANVKGNTHLVNAVTEARTHLASLTKKDSPLYEVYLVHLLECCVGSGDTVGERVVDMALTTEIISQLFRPLAVLVSSDLEHEPEFEDADELMRLSRNSWFNIVVHGFTLNSRASQPHAHELQLLAQYSLPLVDEERVDMPESAIDLNAVLRRGATAQHNFEQKTTLIAALPQCESDIKGLSYPECVFLNAALLVSNLRARSGDCTAVLPYFMESKVKTTPMGNCMLAVATSSVEEYLRRALPGTQQQFSAPAIALQLATFFEGCCHRIAKVQHAAVSSADRIINQVPSALCQKASLFALLELLTLMWRSCLDAETDEYDLKSTYVSEMGNVSLQLSDDVNFRQTTLTNFHKRCRLWVSKAIDAAPFDVKGLLQAYLEDFEDEGSYGHIALGRSFAIEMGATIPNTDQRLVSLDRQAGVPVNTASDFIAQYTTRQDYRRRDVEAEDSEWTLAERDGTMHVTTVVPAPSVISAAAGLRRLSARLRSREYVPFAELDSTLRAAAAVLSQTASDPAGLISHLVSIPFIPFTKQSINLGVSLWLGLVKENPAMETRLLVEIAAGWEHTVRQGKGFFYSAFQYQDPFFIKEEFAPSKWEAITKRQSLVHDLIAPHLRLSQSLSSHFSGSRLLSRAVERVYSRLMRVTLFAMRHAVSHPLAREVHFHIVLLALRILRFSTSLRPAAQWRLKDAALSASLSWFAVAPRWSFGSSRLQLKAEIRLLGDVLLQLHALSGVGAQPRKGLASLQSKQDLLVQLIAHEIGRLTVWTQPLASEGNSVKDAQIAPLIGSAWQEDPRIALQLPTRFPQSDKIFRDVRWLLMREPERAIHESTALYIMLGQSLPSDVQAQLKYLLYWAPINPMAAVTYFMPSYGNHPFIIQYAMRALESHSVDVTFFYVPQIVQSLRYDTLGYVERYIVETAKFSQLFAHQIIWNMKANSYKDDDSQEPDPVKPVLDKVTDSLTASFSGEDLDFYHREFDFFGRVTGISGTLKPFIKSPKPEKKAKIEEELRKIQVDVGVYLPSNPDGVVIGIDRKSGKPLQSHAKAPYMATFRIRKEEGATEPEENLAVANGDIAKRRTYEVWQSAIFKVGDDCRQDVLALQLIACFRGIFNSVGLDVYVFPYRVTATAPGCGVIDVLPNSISRDMLGREAVNGLYEYFVSRYGSEDSIRFQQARSNFVKSMAAYSIISYLLQFKDRHNGNIMIDDAGHILHIDFGFCFDIAPGGVKFERAPFKLSQEMVAVMGGSTQSQPFRQFEELCVKAFLASRQYVDQLAHVILTMLDSGLPCFKPTTIQNFRDRFVLEKTDREAADFVRKLVHWSERSYSTGVYDYFQLLTNGIPY